MNERSPARIAARGLVPFVLLVLFAFVAPLASAQQEPGDFAPGTLLEVTPREVLQPADVQRQGRPLFEGFGLPEARYAVEAYDVRFVTSDFDGSPVEVRAQFFVPRLDAPAERPVYVFGSGTTGLVDMCAPSLEQPEVRRLGHYRANMLAYAAQGFITMMPDYVGFHDASRPQRYFSARAEAHVMLDAIRATFNFFEANERTVRPSQAVFTSGYSQGGHAAFAAADLRPRYAPEVPLTGVIGYGSTTNVETLLREGPYYAPYIVYTYKQMYGADEIDASRILGSRWVPTLEADVLRMCVDGMQQYFPFDGAQMYSAEFAAALYGGALEAVFPAFHARLQENKTGISGHGLPSLVVHGLQDIIVTTPAQTEFVQELCEAGSDVRYMRMDGVRHRHTRPAGFAASVAWMEAIASGDVPPSDCVTVLAEQ